MRIYMEGLSLAERNILCSFISTKCSLPGATFIRFKLNICFSPRLLPTASGHVPSSQVALVSQVIKGD